MATLLVAGLAAPVAVGAVGIAGARDTTYPAREAGAAALGSVVVPPPRHDPAKPTVALVLGVQGANVADLLAPYEVLADTGRFNLYTVAAERRPVTLTGGLDLLPDLTFAELDARTLAGPDVIVVPQLVGGGTATVAAASTVVARIPVHRCVSDLGSRADVPRDGCRHAVPCRGVRQLDASRGARPDPSAPNPPPITDATTR
ncbi:hypothetical protein ACGF5C_27935 [Micromonospora sp. NPDC047620]|uniref:hypothetical protein n=1 Tax=Micromonospora sp. NPDC047620 TaxID=3364251 RepID=UPI003713015D